MRGLISLAVLSLALASCGVLERKKEKDDGNKKNPSTDGGEDGETDGGTDGPGAAGPRTVLFIDDGFDTTHPIFKDKLAATYTVTCDESADEKLDWDKLTDAEIKTKLLDAYNQPSTCKLDTTLTLDKSPSFAGIAKDRDAWNQGIMSKQGVSLGEDRINEIAGILGGIEGDTVRNYHGTATAGIVAYDNPGVKLVLVQFALTNPTEVEDKVECHKQAGVDRYVKAARDPEVVKAYAERPLDPIDEQLNQMVRDNKVTIVNLSLGGVPRSELEKLYEKKGCGTVSLTEMFKVQRELSDARNTWLKANGPKDVDVLSIQAAGNDGVKVDSPADSGECSDPDNDVVIVGSIDANRNVSSFSNFGKCVDVYSLGESVVVAAPDGFVNVESGTSFSTPMTVRYATKSFASSLSVDDLRTQLVAKRDAEQLLPESSYPLELAFKNKAKPLSKFSLRVAPSDAELLMRDRRARAARRLFGH